MWTALISARYPDVRWVDSETLSDWMDDSEDRELVLLDVRTPEEQQVSHLRDAQHLDSRNPGIEALAIPPSATVVVYCSIGYRSAVIIEELEQAVPCAGRSAPARQRRGSTSLTAFRPNSYRSHV